MPPQATPPKKKSNGCLVAVLVVLVLGTLSAVGIGFALYRGLGGFLGGMGEIAGLMMRAGKAPGTKAMRSAGCDEAFVIDMEELSSAAQKFEDEMAKREGRDPREIDLASSAEQYAICKVKLGTLPSCNAVATEILDEVDVEGRLLVTVQGATGASGCNELFDGETGKSLGDAKHIDVPGAP